MGLFTRYEQLPGGQNAGPLPGSGSSRMEKRQLRRSIIISSFFMALTLLILVLAFRRNPQWWEPVGQFDVTPAGGSSSSSSDIRKDEGDTLPMIDWSWTGSDSSSKSWWSPSSSSPKIGSKAWLGRYPDFVHGPAPRQVGLQR